MAAAKEVKTTPKSSIIIMPPEGTTGWTQIQAIREKHDKSYVRWMPHINMLYPFMEDANDGRDFQDAANNLTEALSNVKPFKIKFSRDSFGFFTHKKSATLWLKPLTLDTVSETNPSDDVTQEAGASNTENVPDTDTDIAPVKSKKKKAQKPKFTLPDLPNHEDVLDLQLKMVETFPFSDDLNKISDKGFQPHLSLGQFGPREIDEYCIKFQQEWQDFEIDVAEVYLISRANFDDPFHIRHAVRLGGST